MPERRHVAVAHLLRSLAALTARKDGPNVCIERAPGKD